MRSELQAVLDSLPKMQPEELPELLGELEVIRATAMMRLSTPVPAINKHDELIPIEDAAKRLGVSADHLYRHSGKYRFTRRIGRKLLFSCLGIDEYIRKSGR
jgi:excisionase family DNA binding protein